MARRSPPLVSQKCETGCTWRMFGIFNFHEAPSDRRLVSNGSHLNKHTTGNGKSRINSDVLSTVDEKYPHAADVSSKRKRGLSCKNICVEEDQIADLENEVTKMIVNQRFFDRNSRGKDGAADCQPNQFLDAVQILYSNKELFVKLLQDPNSLLVKQIHDLQKSQVKAEQNGMTRSNKAQSSGGFDRSKSSSNCEARTSKRIVVLKPNTDNVTKSSDNSDAQSNKPSHFPFGDMKRKLRHVMRVRRKEKQWSANDSAASKSLCGLRDLEDGKNVKELDISVRNPPNKICASIGDNLIMKDQGAKVTSHNKHQMVLRALHRDEENCSYRNSSAQKIKDPPVATFCDELQVCSAADISVNKRLHDDNFHEHYDIPTDGSLVQAIHDKFEENNHLADLVTFSLNPMNKSNDIISEVLQAFSLKCDEPIKSHLSNLLADSSTFDELNGLTDHLSSSKILHDCIIQCFMDLHQNSGFLSQFSSRNPNFLQACVVKKILVREINEVVNLHFVPHSSPITLQQVVEKDLTRRGSWMNIHVDAEDIAIEVENDVLEKLVLEIVSDMDIR
ncbi:uncharacterized protein LOC127105558 isoform X3 [Lathyrus oleraceus]|uniref:DUF4378 domain-containing protein n=1 Tax=Pisum sativum TaxID=3888 RepID=A0A9D4ZV26_PEA|nr:uncharacterized protein LOC127105558 isoform X3 [Pisum sativum]KAI5383663.1 hypothetical protein KIW84_070876 [Pisum sativum]